MTDTAGKPADPGEWPAWYWRLLNDLRRKAPPADGIKARDPGLPKWTSEANANTELVRLAATTRREAFDGALSAVEARAARLLQSSVLVLALLVTNVSFHLREWNWSEISKFLSVPFWIFATLGFLFLLLSSLISLVVDRVGVTWPISAIDISMEKDGRQQRLFAAQELRAAAVAQWTSKNKLDELLRASAWFTRGLSMVLLNVLLGLVLWAYQDSQASDGPVNPPEPVEYCCTVPESSSSPPTSSPNESTNAPTAEPESLSASISAPETTLDGLAVTP